MDEIISTHAHAPAQRVAAWNEAACTHLALMDICPFDSETFSGRMRRAELASIRAIDISCRGARVHRSAAHVARISEAIFLLDLQLQGESVVKQGGREARLRPGDFVLTDSTRPHQVVFDAPVSMRLLRIPASTLQRFVGCPEEVAGLRIDGSAGNGRIASRFLRDSWLSRQAATLQDGAPHVERAALELVASACAQFREARSERSSLGIVHRLQAIEYIEGSLEKSGLSPASISAALRITPRYLHRLFNGDGETVGRYILRRRLEQCADQLNDALHERRHVSDIAFGCGFSTLSHFCRTFRDRYGLSPGDFREAARQKRLENWG